ncbi:hypothetical protein D2T29_00440 [Sinirhodobacter populi]|uniref:Uncharacterized protein n=1 Tax=Paenirhodobacter populi TaxID=2306993 RepID=A0A443KPZ5_9RHOB|nr:hypothetical protein [Sinirhodobacter populi]RWR34979.1 hypothetical protein D2T29_00440 [Sinirhodobacter populi]
MAADVGIQMAALSAGLRAMAGTIEVREVTRLLDQAATLDEDEPLRSSIARFVERYATVRRDPDALSEAGAELRRAVELGVMTNPPDLSRRDIHG